MHVMTVTPLRTLICFQYGSISTVESALQCEMYVNIVFL